MGKQQMKQGKKKRVEINEEEEDLDRFAGSSAEEDNSIDDEDASEPDEDEAVAMKPPDKSYEAHADDEDSSGESEEDQKRAEEEDDSSDDEDGPSNRAAGLANAMARILGTAAKGTKGTKPVVLSKTKTRIQKQAAKEREKEQEMKEKRQNNRERELQALHIPLSVATSHQVGNKNKAIVKELEMERVHRRVATRGVVALFNAIAQHQNQNAKERESAVLSTSKTDVKKMTKHGFLDMIKNKAVEKADATPKPTNDKDGPQWQALQDDFMLNPKKNWDQESSDDEEEEDTPTKMSAKRQKTAA